MNRFLPRLSAGAVLAAAALAAMAPAFAADAPAKAPAPAAAASAAAPAAAPAAPAPAAASAAPAEVEAAVLAWASAWASKDVDKYLASYASDFQPAKGASHKAWEEQRRKRIGNKSSISVKVDNLVVSVNGNTATAKFKQSYAADKIKESGRKTLELQRVDGRWLIRKESAGG
ncbi:nuclear transport factor 2 family protein [Variovorax sp. Varisp41]|jgi:ketosteroid isomerase-like protein|nr:MULTISPECIES: nuclear transport factor 2 family protein [unclassified Variovorax]MBS82423.1 nuclear transport factor 2 family protein [Variovorax sp.]MCT8174227.1 nuclear transport factor 2 family protein [Variovorax sp. CY25R-8]